MSRNIVECTIVTNIGLKKFRNIHPLYFKLIVRYGLVKKTNIRTEG
jgi:hypothetical protein